MANVKDPLPVTLIRRARQFGGSAFGSPVAVMFLLRELTEAEYGAAQTYERAYRDFLAAIDARTLRAASVEPGVHAQPPDADSDQGRSQARRETAAKNRFETLNAIRKGCGAEAARDFEAVVCAGVQPTWPMRQSVARVCRALASARLRKDARDDGRSNRRKSVA